MPAAKFNFAETLWGYCFFEEAKVAAHNGSSHVEFDAVDRRVLAMSKTLVEWKVTTGVKLPDDFGI